MICRPSDSSCCRIVGRVDARHCTCVPHEEVLKEVMSIILCAQQACHVSIHKDFKHGRYSTRDKAVFWQETQETSLEGQNAALSVQ